MALPHFEHFQSPEYIFRSPLPKLVGEYAMTLSWVMTFVSRSKGLTIQTLRFDKGRIVAAI